MAEEQTLDREEELKEEAPDTEYEETAEGGAEQEAEENDTALEDDPDNDPEKTDDEPADPAEIPIRDGDEESAGSSEKEPRRFFKKKEKKKDPRDEKILDLTDKFQRLMAEFDNFRKRTDKEKATMYDMGVSSTVEKLLPVLDNFERGLASVPEEQKTSSVYVGMDMIYKQMVKVLTDMGVEPIDAAGKEFDPNLHNAVMQTESEELPENTVAQELQKGYTYKGTVIRHSMVSVVK